MPEAARRLYVGCCFSFRPENRYCHAVSTMVRTKIQLKKYIGMTGIEFSFQFDCSTVWYNLSPFFSIGLFPIAWREMLTSCHK